LDVVEDKKKLDQVHLQHRTDSRLLQPKRANNEKDDETNAKEEYELRSYFRNVHFFARRDYFIPSYMRDNKPVKKLETNFIPTRWNQDRACKELQISEDRLEEKSYVKAVLLNRRCDWMCG